MGNLSDLSPWAAKGKANIFTAKQTLAASATGSAGLNLPQGTAPSSPGNGDVWTTSAGLFARINGTTYGPLTDGKLEQIESISPAGDNATFDDIPQTYRQLVIAYLGVSHNGGGPDSIELEFSINNGSSYAHAQRITTNLDAADTVSGTIEIDNYNQAISNWVMAKTQFYSSTSLMGGAAMVVAPAGAINAIRVGWGSTNHDAGTYRLFGRR